MRRPFLKHNNFLITFNECKKWEYSISALRNSVRLLALLLVLADPNELLRFKFVVDFLRWVEPLTPVEDVVVEFEAASALLPFK